MLSLLFQGSSSRMPVLCIYASEAPHMWTIAAPYSPPLLFHRHRDRTASAHGGSKAAHNEGIQTEETQPPPPPPPQYHRVLHRRRRCPDVVISVRPLLSFPHLTMSEPPPRRRRLIVPSDSQFSIPAIIPWIDTAQQTTYFSLDWAVAMEGVTGNIWTTQSRHRRHCCWGDFVVHWLSHPLSGLSFISSLLASSSSILRWPRQQKQPQ
jgi:hypothetical protein